MPFEIKRNLMGLVQKDLFVDDHYWFQGDILENMDSQAYKALFCLELLKMHVVVCFHFGCAVDLNGALRQFEGASAWFFDDISERFGSMIAAAAMKG